MMAKTIMTERFINLVSPLAHKATDMRTADTNGSRRDRSGAVSTLIGESLLGCDIDSENTTPRLLATPGIRTSTTATRTTTTSTTSFEPEPSADQCAAPQPDFTFSELAQAYFDCRQSKRNSASALAFEQNLERNLGTLFNLDPAQVRKEAISEKKEQEKVGKSAKKAVSPVKIAKNPAGETSADAPDATNAARAGESMAPKSVEHAPAAIAAQAGESMLDGAWPALKVKSEELIERDEKPTPADAPAPVADASELHVGDRVLIKHGLKGMSGQKRKCCGREGVIEALAGGYIHVRTAPGVNGKITNLVWNEVDKLPTAAPAADVKAKQKSGRASPSERKPVKSTKVLNEKTVHA